jgi:phage I-like protein
MTVHVGSPIPILDAPRTFRILAAGKNGAFTFDTHAAKCVLEAARRNGGELMVDYDHASLSRPVDPALDGRAAAWFGLEVRRGELWAVNVRWTEPAAEALRRKEWLAVAPVFRVEGVRISAIVNLGLTGNRAASPSRDSVVCLRVWSASQTRAGLK